jgi:hypothetical protein
MNTWRHLASAAISACTLIFAGTSTLGHDHTKRQFQQQRAVAAARAEQRAELAPPAADADKTCRLTIELVPSDTGKAATGLVRLMNLSTGKFLTFKDEILREVNWHSVAGPVTLVVPRTRIKIEAFQGLDTELATREVDLTGLATGTARLTLRRFYDPAARGLKAGNTHLHLMKLTHAEAVRYLQTVPRGDRLDLVFISHLRRKPEDVDYITNTFTEGDLGRLSQSGVLFGNGEEHRHNFGPGGEGYGHVMFLNLQRLIEPVSIGPGIMKEGTDGRPLATGIREARGQQATVIWCHNQFGHEDLPNWASGLLDAQNIYDGNPHGTYSDTYYRYLNVGLKVPFSTGTDWFIYDFSRVYLPLAGELTARRWLAELAAGRSYITNGVFLELEAEGSRIGDTISADAGQELAVTGRGLGRTDFRGVELIHNGDVIHTVKSAAEAGHFAADLGFRLKITQPGWIALRIPLEAGKNEFDKPLFAHTSPIYVEVGDRRIFRPAVAGELIADMQRSIEAIKTQGKFASASEQDAVLRVYRDAIGALEKRIREQPQ